MKATNQTKASHAPRGPRPIVMVSHPTDASCHGIFYDPVVHTEQFPARRVSSPSTKMLKVGVFPTAAEGIKHAVMLNKAIATVEKRAQWDEEIVPGPGP